MERINSFLQIPLPLLFIPSLPSPFLSYFLPSPSSTSQPPPHLCFFSTSQPPPYLFPSSTSQPPPHLFPFSTSQPPPHLFPSSISFGCSFYSYLFLSLLLPPLSLSTVLCSPNSSIYSITLLSSPTSSISHNSSPTSPFSKTSPNSLLLPGSTSFLTSLLLHSLPL